MTSPDNLQVFHHFPELPIEVRLMIWEYNLPEPRILNIQPKFLTPPERLLTLAATVNPYESREEAMKRYEPFFDVRAYMDPSRDIFSTLGRSLRAVTGYPYEDPEDWLEAFVCQAHPEDLACARHIAIGKRSAYDIHLLLPKDRPRSEDRAIGEVHQRALQSSQTWSGCSLSALTQERLNTPPLCYQHESLHV
ncbi:uncharacterized protein F4812DRAFT_462123 [Daldinia caldariorum]|uniref:uncharacterized protein n=1 Tax=Daldinia caldariorum TaxID=326644 RepID=UPI002007D080|nr:uncharacterized protein F4812DRAFT_462123 [Daldinia caldariorum]KAI1465280.1 hypothetical protein F4812DRAFT_462123 [Daldinia caldariorum]